MIFISLFAAMLCIVSPFFVPIGTVPVTLSLFALFVSALVLPGFDSVTAVLIYILLGCVGLPVFSGFRGGFSVLFSATGGFLWAYPIVAFIISMLKSKSRVMSLVMSLAFCYMAGAIQLKYVTGISLCYSVLTGVIPFVPFDVVKLVAALFVSKPLQKACASFYKLR